VLLREHKVLQDLKVLKVLQDPVLVRKEPKVHKD
jgi:hypothetical protein